MEDSSKTGIHKLELQLIKIEALASGLNKNIDRLTERLDKFETELRGISKMDSRVVHLETQVEDMRKILWLSLSALVSTIIIAVMSVVLK